MFFVFLARFKAFKGMGIQAELWEDKQLEAAILIERLKGLAGTTAGPLLSISSRMDRLGSTFNRREEKGAQRHSSTNGEVAVRA
jgi:hypothetical protein